jgi:hypothetical protein
MRIKHPLKFDVPLTTQFYCTILKKENVAPFSYPFYCTILKKENVALCRR